MTKMMIGVNMMITVNGLLFTIVLLPPKENTKTHYHQKARTTKEVKESAMETTMKKIGMLHPREKVRRATKIEARNRVKRLSIIHRHPKARATKARGYVETTGMTHLMVLSIIHHCPKAKATKQVKRKREAREQ